MKYGLIAIFLLLSLYSTIHARPVVMMTGYWPPTSEMIYRFSDDPELNPDGWIGENWEGSGYNIHAYFPEFPGGTEANPKGDGDFEVDYQDTSADFWRITDEIEPIAIISFGLAEENNDWRVEGGNRKYSASYWYQDYLYPQRPTSDLPIYHEPNGYRWSSLPMTDIVDAVNIAVPTLNAHQTNNDTSRFLCNFLGYHVNWYHDMHSAPSDEAWNIAAGFIHVGSNMTLAEGELATQTTLRTVIDYVNTVVPEPGAGLLFMLVLPVMRRR